MALLLPLCRKQIHLRAHQRRQREEAHTSMPELVQCETLYRARVNMDDDGVQSMLADITMQTEKLYRGISMGCWDSCQIYITADSVQIMDR